MSKTVKGKSLNAELLEVAKPTKCVSKIGVNISQMFVLLKQKEVGDISVIGKHRGTKHRADEENAARERTL